MADVEAFKVRLDTLAQESAASVFAVLQALVDEGEEAGLWDSEGQALLRMRFEDQDLVLILGVEHTNYEDEEDD